MRDKNIPWSSITEIQISKDPMENYEYIASACFLDKNIHRRVFHLDVFENILSAIECITSLVTQKNKRRKKKLRIVVTEQISEECLLIRRASARVAKYRLDDSSALVDDSVIRHVSATV